MQRDGDRGRWSPRSSSTSASVRYRTTHPRAGQPLPLLGGDPQQDARTTTWSKDIAGMNQPESFSSSSRADFAVRRPAPTDCVLF